MLTPGIPTCPSCQYELRGLPLRGTCPECGTHYSLSLPGLEPGSLPPTDRYQRFAYESSLSKMALLKGLVLCLGSVGIITAWKAADAEESASQEALGFLIRFGISLAAAVAIYICFCMMNIFDYTGPLLRAFLGVAGALGAAMLTQHVLAQVPGVGMLLGIPWLVGFLVYLGVAADLLELDLTDAGLFAIVSLGARLILKFTLFDHM